METKKRIKIIHDSSPANPFTDWDCGPPLMFQSDRNITDYSDGAIRDFIISTACEKYELHKEKILEITGVDADDYEGNEDEILTAICDCIVTNDQKMLIELCILLDIKHKNYTSKGYSQGDYAYVLIVLTDEFFERTGCDIENSENILEGTAKLFDAWCWGDVYGFSIEECKSYAKIPAEEFKYGSMDNVEYEEEWEEVDSCWGFYGNDFMTNGMKDYVPEELHDQLKNYNHSEIIYR